MLKKKIFREKAFEKLSSPEELDKLMEITTSKGWIALAALIIIILIIIYWGITGSIPVKVAGKGILFSKNVLQKTASAGLDNLEVTAFIDAADSKKIKEGMNANIILSYVRKEEYGFIIGKVSFVSDFPANADDLKKKLNNEFLINKLTQNIIPVEMRIELSTDTSTVSGYKWSSISGYNDKIHSGTLCDVQIIIENRKPVKFIIP